MNKNNEEGKNSLSDLDALQRHINRDALMRLGKLSPTQALEEMMSEIDPEPELAECENPECRALFDGGDIRDGLCESCAEEKAHDEHIDSLYEPLLICEVDECDHEFYEFEDPDETGECPDCRGRGYYED